MSRIATIFLIATSIFFAPRNVFAKDKPIKIGVITDLSGPAAYFGRSTQIGATMAVRALEAAGGREWPPVELIFEDSGLNPQRGISAAQKLIHADGVDALYVDFSRVATAVAPVATNGEKIMISCSSAEALIETNPKIFKVFLGITQGCRAVAEKFKEEGIQRLGILKAEEEYGELCLKGIKEVYPDFFEQTFKQGEVVAPQFLRFKAEKVMAILNVGYEADLENMIKAASKIAYRPKLGVLTGMPTVPLRKQYGTFLENSLAFGLHVDTGELKSLVHTFAPTDKVFNPEPLSLSYVHLQQLVKSVAVCPDRSVSCISQHLASSPSEPLIKFRGFKDRKAQYDQPVYRIVAGEFSPMD